MTFHSYKDRDKPSVNQIVQVYKNLHNGKWSIKDKRTQLVLGYADEITLENCKFHVSESGRQKVIERKVKSVHAWIEGQWIDSKFISEGIPITYNPYLDEGFTTFESDRKDKLTNANRVHMRSKDSLVLVAGEKEGS